MRQVLLKRQSESEPLSFISSAAASKELVKLVVKRQSESEPLSFISSAERPRDSLLLHPCEESHLTPPAPLTLLAASSAHTATSGGANRCAHTCRVVNVRGLVSAVDMRYKIERERERERESESERVYLYQYIYIVCI